MEIKNFKDWSVSESVSLKEEQTAMKFPEDMIDELPANAKACGEFILSTKGKDLSNETIDQIEEQMIKFNAPVTIKCLEILMDSHPYLKTSAEKLTPAQQKVKEYSYSGFFKRLFDKFPPSKIKKNESINDEELENFEMSESETADFMSAYLLEAEDFKVTEPKIEGGSITLKINNDKYKFVAPKAEPNTDPIDMQEVFRKFQKMMGFAKAGVKALAWLHKQVGKGEKI